MRAVHFMITDLISCKSQSKFLIFFAALALFLSMTAKSGSIFGGMYMTFAAIIFSAQPFRNEQLQDAGFLNMLPGSKLERVAGRYLYGLALLLVGVVSGTLVIYLANLKNGDFSEGIFEISFVMLVTGLIVCSVQNILFYAVGRGKNQQLMGIIYMIPGFVIFFAGMSLLDYLRRDTGALVMDWFMNHRQQVAAGALALAVIVYILGIFVSTRIIKRRDLN